jgi:hypothetical protein
MVDEAKTDSCGKSFPYSIDEKSFYIDATMDEFSLKITDKIHHPKNRLVLIGQKLNEEQIEASFLTGIIPKSE